MAEQRFIAGIPCHEGSTASPPASFPEGAAFWRALEPLLPADRVADGLDGLMAGATAPRTWLLLHEPGQAAVGAASALMLARALMGRGQGVLVLDIDESGAALTAWAGRGQTEGWIDVARFGASVLAAGASLPFGGGRGLLLGIGSFVPTDASEDEIVSLHARLRHHADDILLVGAATPEVLPWARRAERSLLCWDRAVHAEGDLPVVLAALAAAQVPVTGILGWGPVVARPEAPADAGPAAGAEAPAPALAAAGTPDLRAAAPAGGPARVVPLDELAPLDAEPEPARRNPRLFWLAAAAFGVAIVASAWYWTNYVRVPPGGYFEPVATRETPAAAGDVAADTTAGAQPAPRVAEAGGLASLGDTLPGAAEEPARDAVAGPAGPAAATAFDRAPYTVPVGSDGWSLHVYSLADSSSAAQQVAALAGQGFRAAVRIVEIKERGGRWWRVYVGSFPSRSAAAAAMPALLGRLKADWAEPARIRESNP